MNYCLHQLPEGQCPRCNNQDDRDTLIEEIQKIRTATLDEVDAVVWEECSRRAIDNLRGNDG